MRFVWATRGRSWGFRFLNTGELDQPRAVYLDLFDGREFSSHFFERRGPQAAVRFEDPEGRLDRSGRVITHDFVVLEGMDESIQTVEAARAAVWPSVADEYAEFYEQDSTPQPR